MKHALKKVLALLLSLVFVFGFAACSSNNGGGGSSSPSDGDIIKPDQTNKLLAYTSKQESGDNGLVLSTKRNVNDEYFIYYFYLGVISRVPVYTSVAMQYEYDTTVKMSFEKINEESLSNSVSKSTEVIDTHSYTGGFDLDFEESITMGASALFASVKAEFKASQSVDQHWTNNWGSIVTESNSTTNSYLSRYSTGYEETVEFSEKAGFIKNNYYRMSFYETVSAYGVLIYDVKEETYYPTTDFFLKENTTVRVWEESTDGNFEYGNDDKLDFDINTAIAIAEENKLEIEDQEPESLSAKAEIVSTTFSSYLWADSEYSSGSKNLGKVDFSVTGIKVKYGDKYYIYGNAWYNGTPGGGRNDNATSLYLKDGNKKILMGGVLHWRSTYADSNECGVASWIRSNGMDTYNVSYMPEDPTKDVSAGENISLSITDICVEYEGTPTEYDCVPEVVTSTLTADFVCESSKMGTLNFDLIGIKAKYENSYYLMGNAFYSGTPGGFRFKNVGDIYLENSDKNILFGGTLGWRGSVSDNQEAGICGYSRNNWFNSTKTRYMIENPDKDFAGNEENYISITGICVKLGGDATNDLLVPEIVTTSFTSSLYCESSFRGTGNFSCVGIKVEHEGENYLYGNAFSSGTPGQARFNDVASFSIRETTKTFLLGGTLHWYGSNNDINESAVAGFNKGESEGNQLMYLHEDPLRDFAANEENEISITGICVKL